MYFFSVWIYDPKFRYEIGWYYTKIFILVGMSSLLMIIIDIYYQVKKAIMKLRHKRVL
mgnify:CR=1 FL=1